MEKRILFAAVTPVIMHAGAHVPSPSLPLGKTARGDGREIIAVDELVCNLISSTCFISMNYNF
jgi:hypothetical protein